MSFRWRRQWSPLLMRSPSPSQGLKNRYSSDFSKCVWLFKINSTSAGWVKKITSLFPSQPRATLPNSLLILRAISIISGNSKNANVIPGDNICGYMGESKRHYTLHSFSMHFSILNNLNIIITASALSSHIKQFAIPKTHHCGSFL